MYVKPAVGRPQRRDTLPGNKFWRPTQNSYPVPLPLPSSGSESEKAEAASPTEPFFSALTWKEEREDQEIRDHVLTVLRNLLIEQQAQYGSEMTDQQLDHELMRASMSLASRPLNDLPLEAGLFLRVGRSSEEVCDRKWLLNAGKNTELVANILDMAGETMEDVEAEYRKTVLRKWKNNGVLETYVPSEETLQANSVQEDGYETWALPSVVHCTSRPAVLAESLVTMESRGQLSMSLNLLEAADGSQVMIESL